jgi:methionyl-tRNA formyltransferase
MVNHIETFEPKCTKQTGKIVTFKRMGIDDARIPMNNGIVRIYDWIRMLDADGYPHAFIDEGEYRLYFSGAVLNDGEVNADVKIVKRDCNDR